MAELPAYLKKRFPQENESVDGILCWDLIDYLDKPAALAASRWRIKRAAGTSCSCQTG